MPRSRPFHILVTSWVVAGFCAAPLFGQFGAVAFGVKGGIPIADASGTSLQGGCMAQVSCVQSTYSSETKRYTLGPTIQWRLPRGFALEADVLYNRLSYDSTTFQGTFQGFPSSTAFLAIQAHRWEFPLLVKWQYGTRKMRPFVDGGVSLDHISFLGERFTNVVQDASGAITTSSGIASAPDFTNRNIQGGVVGGGVDLPGVWRLRVTPEVRYTRWDSTQFTAPANVSGTNRNQVTFVLGIGF